MVFDNRNFGASGGEPRQEIDPWEQVRDYRDAITFVETLRGWIGIWGSSYSGGHVLVVGAIDRRVKCVAGQVPLISGHNNARRLIRADFWVSLHRMFDDDRRNRYAGNPRRMIPVVAEDPLAPSALPTPDSWSWFTETGRSRAPSWHNEVTLRSVEMFTEYEPGSYIGFISPTPLLLIVALGDHLTVADEALAAYERALEPKKLVMLSGGHFDAYVKDFEPPPPPLELVGHPPKTARAVRRSVCAWRTPEKPHDGNRQQQSRCAPGPPGPSTHYGS